MAKVLIVDDNMEMLDTLEHLFTFYDFDVVRAENGKEALEIVEKEQPSVIILDALMPVMNGFETCQQLKRNPRTRDIPIIFLSANYTEDEHRLRGFDLGADEYMLKPFNVKELLARVNTLLNKKSLIENLRKDNISFLRKQSPFASPAEEVKPAGEEFLYNSNVDEITGIYNRAFFQKRLPELYRSEKELSLVLLDVDFFQRINEIYGEHTGDYVLMKLANTILQHTRISDVVFRLEKNTFAILMPATSETTAFYEAERIRSAISTTQFFDQDFFELKRISHQRKQEIKHLTVSIGIASNEETNSASELVHHAEVALDSAKKQGRNVTVKFSEHASSEHG